MHFSRPEGESTDQFFERTNGSIKRILAMHNFRTWDEQAHLEVHRWAGFLARLTITDPVRFTSVVFAHKDWLWIQTIANNNAGRQLHGRYLKTWRWERPLYNFYGRGWQSRAQNKELWKADKNIVLQYRVLNR